MSERTALSLDQTGAPVHSNVKVSVFSVCCLFADVSGGFVLCLFCKGSVGELHEEHNNSAGEAL